MKKLFFVLYACLCVGLWSCSNDDEPAISFMTELHAVWMMVHLFLAVHMG